MNPVKKNTRQASPLSTRAAVKSANLESRTVEVTWSTGAKVLRSTWSNGSFFEELDMSPQAVRLDRLNSGAPFLANHDGYDVARTLGVVVPGSARVDGKTGVATIRFAKAEDDPEADKVFRKIADGIITSVSVGYRTWKAEKIENPADKTVPTLRAIDWEPYEISAVALPADAGAGFRSDAGNHEVEIITHPQEHRTVMNEEEIKAKQEAEAAAKRAAELEAATKRAAQLERDRVVSIEHAVRSAGLEAAFATALIADGSALDKAREAVLTELAKRSDDFKTEQHTPPAVGVRGEDARDKFVRGVSAWLFSRAGDGLVAKAKAQKAEGFEDTDIGGAEFRGMTLLDIARACCERAGISTRGVYDRTKLIDLALNARSGYAGATTSDFAVLFENVMYKQMRAGYATQSDTWRRWCGTDTVSDFRSANRFLNGSFGTLPVVPEGAEYVNQAIPDGEKTSISTETRGGIIALSRQAIINDDLGALVDVATRFGLTGARSIEVAVYALLALNSGFGPTMADGQPFFHANRANVATGAALSGAALDADRLVMRQQRDISSNDYLDLMPRILLLPIQLETAARSINTAEFDHDSTKLQKPNMQRNMFGDIVSSPRLSWSTTRRYLFTEAKEAFKVVFLAGSGEGPTLESRPSFRTDGVEWKARLDFKVNPYDPKTAVTNAGV